MIKKWTGLALIASGCIWWGWSLTHMRLPEGTAIFSNQCRDDLDLLFVTAIREAKESVDLEIFSLSRARIIRELNRAAERGCAVHIAYDDKYTSRLPLHPDIRQEPRRPKGLMHRKLLVIDEKRRLIGSANFTYESLRMHGNLVVQVGEDAQVWKDGEAMAPLLEAIESAQRSLRIAMYTWTHPQLTEAVIAAHRRGAHVEVILDRTQSRHTNKKSAQKLVEAGVEVRIHQGPELLHHKMCWVDERVLCCGSFNWTKSAEKKNEELLVRIETDAPKLKKLWRILRLESSVLSA